MNPLDAILKPKSIAVVGASRREGSIGREILHQLIEFDFHGKLFPVNPKADFIHSMKAFPNVSSHSRPGGSGHHRRAARRGAGRRRRLREEGRDGLGGHHRGLFRNRRRRESGSKPNWPSGSGNTECG